MTRKRILIGIPHQGTVPIQWSWSYTRFRLYEARLDVRDLASDFLSGYCVAQQRETIAHVALQKAFDGILWLDSDVALPETALERLLYHDHHIVSGLVFLKKQENERWLPSMWKDGQYLRPEGESLVSVDGVGFGCLWTDIRVFQEMKTPFFRHRGEMGAHEDGFFCDRAREAGFPIYVDPTVRCRHYWNLTESAYVDEQGRLAGEADL